MKIVILGNTSLNYSWFVLSTREGCKANGHKVYEIDYKSTPIPQIYKKCEEIKPDIMFTHLSFHGNVNSVSSVLELYEKINKKLGTKIIHTLGDAQVATKGMQDRYMGDVSHAIHMAFVSNRCGVENMSKAWKIPVFYSPYSSLIYKELETPDNTLAFDVPVFTGGIGAHPDRKQFIEAFQKEQEIVVFPTQSKSDKRHVTAKLSISAKCILGLCTGYDIDGFIDVRPFQYLGTGAFMISRKFENMDTIIPDDLYVPFHGYTQSDVYFVQDRWNYWKTKNTMEMRVKAFNYIQEKHNCKVRMGNVLDCIEGKSNKVV